MSDPITPVVLTAFLSVSFVGADKGFPLTPNSAYVCGYDKVLYEIHQAGNIDVVFVPSTSTRFRMLDVRIDNDLAGEYGQQRSVANRQLSFSAANLTEQQIYFAVTIEDIQTGAQFECDPALFNRPPK